MADTEFDAVVIGGGTKSLVAALYLQTYGGMKVGIFENRHEIGGCWDYQDAPVPGFTTDAHSSNVWDWYFLPMLNDFPDLEEKGMKFLSFPASGAVQFAESDDCLMFYHHEYDPTGERTAGEIARFSERDAETFLKIEKAYYEPGGLKEAKMAQIFNLPPPPGQPDAMGVWLRDYLKRPDALFDEQMLYMSAFQAGRELFDGVELRCMVLNGFPYRTGYADEPMGALRWLGLSAFREVELVVGGNHNIAHAVIRTIVENGGKFFTKSEVDKILIENEEVKGIRLVNGTEVRGRIVISGVDPYQLAFRFIGEGHLSPKTMRRVANLERECNNVAVAQFALHELPNYRAASFNPDLAPGRFHFTEIGDKKDDREIAREVYLLRSGTEPEEGGVYIGANHTGIDRSRAPEGKHIIYAVVLTLPLRARTEREWLDYRNFLAHKVLKRMHRVAPNMTWDNVIGLSVASPYEMSKSKLNMPTGNQTVIDETPAQSSNRLPIPEWADHRVRGVKNLYGAGVAWGAAVGAHCGQGYRCYKAIAEDFGLRKPWEEKNRPW